MGRLLKKAAEMETAAGRKRKVYNESESSIQLKSRRLDDGLASCCSSNGSSELALEASKFVDLELDYYEATVDSNSLDCGESFRRETTALREAGELESTPPEQNPRRRVKMPTEAELDEFFSAAEKSIQQKFINKYNFDIVKDEPVEGRYEWVEVQQRRQENSHG